jgi:hypothetical protein
LAPSWELASALQPPACRTAEAGDLATLSLADETVSRFRRSRLCVGSRGCGARSRPSARSRRDIRVHCGSPSCSGARPVPRFATRAGNRNSGELSLLA